MIKSSGQAPPPPPGVATLTQGPGVSRRGPAHVDRLGPVRFLEPEWADARLRTERPSEPIPL